MLITNKEGTNKNGISQNQIIQRICFRGFGWIKGISSDIKGVRGIFGGFE